MPNVGTQFDEIDATLPIFQGISERPVWLTHFGKAADRNVSEAVGHPPDLNVSNWP